MKIRQNKKNFNIGSNIRHYRRASRLTQEQTVLRMRVLGIEISRSSYSQIECGLYNVRVSELLALCEIFHVEIGQFFEGMSIASKDEK